MYIHTCIPSIIMNQSQKHYGEKRKLQISAVSENLILIKITRQYLCFVGTDRLQCCKPTRFVLVLVFGGVEGRR